jgi:hypothetical protein
VEWSEIKGLQRDAQATLSRTQKRRPPLEAGDEEAHSKRVGREAREPSFPSSFVQSGLHGQTATTDFVLQGKKKRKFKRKGKKIQRKIFAQTPTCRLWMNVTCVKEQVHRP